MILNTPIETMLAQARENLSRGLPMFVGQPRHLGSALVIGGGPSLNDTLPKLRFRRNWGGTIFAVGNTSDWLIKCGLYPDFHVLLDARPENVEFVRNPVKGVQYLVAAQCHPSVFQALEGYDVVVWVADVEGMRSLIETHEDKPIVLVGGGGTVGLKAMMLAYLWGFRDIRLFGFDSSYLNGEHHAYPQELNDGQTITEIEVDGETFTCSPWMEHQAQDFTNDARVLMKNGCRLEVYGAGLIPTLFSKLQRSKHAA